MLTDSTSYQAPTSIRIGFNNIREQGINTHASAPDSTAIFNFFHLGSYPFHQTDYDLGADFYLTQTNGLSLNFAYSTVGADQTGSNFNITRVTKTYFKGMYAVQAEGTFNCKVVSNLGAVKNVTNGSFRLIMTQ